MRKLRKKKEAVSIDTRSAPRNQKITLEKSGLNQTCKSPLKFCRSFSLLEFLFLKTTKTGA